jgi:hypothetical protein
MRNKSYSEKFGKVGVGVTYLTLLRMKDVGVRAMVEEAMRGLWCCLLRGFRKCRVPLVS